VASLGLKRLNVIVPPAVLVAPLIVAESFGASGLTHVMGAREAVAVAQARGFLILEARAYPLETGPASRARSSTRSAPS